MNLKETLARIADDLKTLDAQIAETVSTITLGCEVEVADLAADYERQLGRLSASHAETDAATKARYEAYLDTLKDKAAEALEELEELQRTTEDALELQAELEMDRSGVLPTGNLKQRLAFDKLAACWETLNLDNLETYLDSCTK